jgi:hypothetical protein
VTAELERRPDAPAPTQYDELWRLANRIHKTEFVPAAFRGRPDAVLACILTGRALFVAEMIALKHISLINGRPDESAELMRALVKRAGHTLIAEHRTAEKATITGIRADDRTPMTVTWTLDDAVTAELVTLDDDGHPVATTDKGKALPWQAYTRVMLYNRATKELCRAHFGDVLAGLSPAVVDLDLDAELAADEYQSAIEVDSVELAGLSPGPERGEAPGPGTDEVRPPHPASTPEAPAGGPQPADDLDPERPFE